jgi:hypothetical protein
MKKISFLLSLSLLTFGLAGCTLLYPNWGKPTSSPTNTKTDSPKPTDTSTGTPKPTDTTKGQADVEITDASVYQQDGIIQVIAQITNFSEDGGTCTATFTGGGKTVSVSAKAESNAANTQCHPLEINLAGLPSGSGTVTVTYDSATKHGVSSAQAVTIP